MRILVLQLAPDTRGRPLPRFEPQLGVLLTLLRGRGHALSLIGMARFELDRLKRSLARELPQLIYADISGVCINLAQRVFQHLSGREGLSIVAGGQYPSIDPAGALSLPGVHAVAIGEPDATLVTYLERVKDPISGAVTPGVWLRDEQGTSRPKLPHLVEDLDSLPPPDRDLFDYAAHVSRTGQIEVAVGRGCPQRCAYCVNPLMESMYADRGQWVRRRSPQNIMAEIADLTRRFAGVASVRFLDHAFAQDPMWLAALLREFRTTCALSMRCHLRANRATQAIVASLATARCEQIDIEVISGSQFIRDEIFQMDTSEPHIRELFAWCRSAGVRTRAIIYLGAPYESEASLDETRNLLRSIRPDVVDSRCYYPLPATEAAETARENGWLHRRGEEQYHGEQCGIDMPACRPDMIRAFAAALRSEFPMDWGEPWWRRWSHKARQAMQAILARDRMG
ncbi:MAG: radical SAM protein [Phycisphaerales bacterium]|nr:radical SAM protein [Phycisphaerales bacterium]